MKILIIGIIFAVLLLAGCVDYSEPIDCGEIIFTGEDLTEEQNAVMTEKLTCYNEALRECKPATLKMTILGETITHQIFGEDEGCIFGMYGEGTEFNCYASQTAINVELDKEMPDLGKFCVKSEGTSIVDNNEDGGNEVKLGFGESFETAVVVNSIAEEYSFIRGAACLQNDGVEDVILQILIKDNNKMYDVLTVACVNGKEEEYYFDIDNFFGK